MKPVLIFLTLFGTALLTMAQPYRPVRVSFEAFFERSVGLETSLSEAVSIRRVENMGTTGFLYNYPVVNFQSPPVSNCSHEAEGVSWLGEKVVELPGQTYLFFNASGDTIRLNPFVGLGDQYDMFDLGAGERIVAELVTSGLQSVLGVADTVKVFQLTARDANGNLVAHPLNQKEIHLSREYGLVQTLRFLDFPNDPTELPLGGTSLANQGRHNIGPVQIYDWQVGDTFQYAKVLRIFSQFEDSTLEERVILSKNTVGDSVYYEIGFREWRKSTQFMPYQVSTSSSAGVVTERYYIPVPSTPLMPQEFGPFASIGPLSRPATPYQEPTLFYDGDYNDRTQKRHFNLWECNLMDSCLRIPPSFGIPLFSDFAEELGLVHSVLDDPFGTSNSTVLCYYNKGGETWGNRKDFDLLLSHQPPVAPLTIEVFPNPTTDRLFIQTKSRAENLHGKFQLFDLRGVVALEQRLSAGPQATVDLKGVAAGMYSYALRLETGRVEFGKLLVR